MQGNAYFCSAINRLSNLQTQIYRHLRPNKNDKLKQQYRVNEQIRAREVRVIPEEGDSVVMPSRDALRMAQQQGVDLVEISPNAQPPVCRLVDFSKFIYEQKKRQKELKAKQVKVEVKEIRFGPQTDDHDYNMARWSQCPCSKASA